MELASVIIAFALSYVAVMVVYVVVSVIVSYIHDWRADRPAADD